MSCWYFNEESKTQKNVLKCFSLGSKAQVYMCHRRKKSVNESQRHWE